MRIRPMHVHDIVAFENRAPERELIDDRATTLEAPREAQQKSVLVLLRESRDAQHAGLTCGARAGVRLVPCDRPLLHLFGRAKLVHALDERIDSLVQSAGLRELKDTRIVAASIEGSHETLLCERLQWAQSFARRRPRALEWEQANSVDRSAT